MIPNELIEQWLPVVSQHAAHLIWIIPVTLFLIAILQVLYLIVLRATSSPKVKSPPPNYDRQSGINTLEVAQPQPQAAPAATNGNAAYQPAYAGAPAPQNYAPLPAPAPAPIPVVQGQPAAQASYPAGQVQPAPAPLPAPAPANMTPAPIQSSPVGSIKKIVVLSGLADLSEIPFPSNNFTIGRYYNMEANILVGLDDKSVSRKHATFVGDDNLQEYYLTDVGSSYGTYVMVGDHFEQLAAGVAEKVYNADVIQVGNNVKVRLVLPGDTRASTTRL